MGSLSVVVHDMFHKLSPLGPLRCQYKAHQSTRSLSFPLLFSRRFYRRKLALAARYLSSFMSPRSPTSYQVTPQKLWHFINWTILMFVPILSMTLLFLVFLLPLYIRSIPSLGNSFQKQKFSSCLFRSLPHSLH